jgi:hypothetical protein
LVLLHNHREVRGNVGSVVLAQVRETIAVIIDLPG